MGWATALKKQIAAEPEILFSRPVFPLAKIDWPRLVTIDFETYFDAEYTLKKLSTSEYVRDKRFKAQMVGIKIGRGKTKLYSSAARIKSALKAIDWSCFSVLCHNTQFDGLILSHHYGVVPAKYYDSLSMARGLHSNEIGAGLDEVAKFYGGDGKIDGVLNLTAGVLQWTKPLIEQAGLYCARDVDETFRIFSAMHAKYPADEIELIDLTCRMFCDPVLKVDIPRVQAELVRELDRREKLLLAVVDPEDWHDAKLLKGKEKLLPDHEANLLTIKRVIGSNDKFAELLRAEGIEPPRKISPAWMKRPAAERLDEDKYVYAFAKDDAKFISLPDNVDAWRGDFDPNRKGDVLQIALKQLRVRTLVDCRVAVKSTTNVTRAERFLTAGADGMSLPCGYAYYRAHCVPGYTEVLTRQGWVKLQDWAGGEIAQVHPDQRIEFLPATKFAGPIETLWLSVRAPYLNCDFTFGHTMPYFTQKGRNWATAKAAELLNRNAFDVPVSGVLTETGAITSEQMRALVMIQADGSFETDTSTGRRLCVFVKKPRKIERARQLFTAADVPFKEQTYPSHPDMVRFIVRYADYPEWLRPERKFFGPWLLDSTEAARKSFLAELQHWDGYLNHAGCRCYSTSDYVNAEWAVTMAHLSNESASIYHAPAKGQRRANFCVSFRNRFFTKIKKQDKCLAKTPMETFCATTQTGFWLARVGERIFVTGNTGRFGGNNKMNMQNLTRGGELRQSILAPKGYQLAVADSGQIEARVNAWLWGQDNLVEAFRMSDTWDKSRGVARGDDRDAYCRFADSVYGYEVTTDNKLERFVGKVCVLGLGFQMGAAKLQMTLAKGALGGPPVYFELDKCKAIIDSYRVRNYRIQRGWAVCAQIIEQMAFGGEGRHGPISWEANTIWLPNGMALKYPDLKKVMGEKGWEEWSYQSGDQRKKIYGGLLCLSSNTEVLTNGGWKPIISVVQTDLLWDGLDWVNHAGLVDKGIQETINFGGIGITPNHEVLVDECWIPAGKTTHHEAASSCARHYRTPVRGAFSDRALGERWASNLLESALRLWNNKNFYGQRFAQRLSKFMRVPDSSVDQRCQNDSRNERASGLCGVAKHEIPVYQQNTSRVEKLWRTWNHSLREMAWVVRGVLAGYGPNVFVGNGPRQKEQRVRLFSGKLPLGNSSSEQYKSPLDCMGADSKRARYFDSSSDAVQHSQKYAELQNQAQLPVAELVRQTQRLEQVYDLVDAGPRHRFTVRGADGQPFIVHNCENIVQALARIIVMWQMLQINRKYRVVMTTHDEVVSCPKTAQAAAAFAFMEKWMRTAPSWCSTIPLNVEGGYAHNYSK